MSLSALTDAAHRTLPWSTIGLAGGVLLGLVAIYVIGTFVHRYPDDPERQQQYAWTVCSLCFLLVAAEDLHAIATGRAGALGPFDWLAVGLVGGTAGLAAGRARVLRRKRGQ